jgi:large subunit ribosomal protein L29
MNADKIRNLTDVELAHQQTELADQLFKLKFQMKMGQTESLKKIRDLKKDIARMKTIEREKRVAGGNGAVVTVKKAAAPAAKAVETAKAPKAKKAASKVAATEKK